MLRLGLCCLFMGEPVSFRTITAKSLLKLPREQQLFKLSEICARLSIPLVYDVHHHRCNPDGLSIEEATQLAAETWHVNGREQYCHLSSPRAGWVTGNPKPHADYIDLADVPGCWLGRTMTVDIEAKAKELAVVTLMTELKNGGSK